MKKILSAFSLFIILGVFCKISLADEQAISPPPTTATPIASETITVPKPIPQYTIKITSPQPEETFQNEAQSITVTVAITPELEPDDKVVIYVDGNPAGEPIHSTSISIPWLERGEHTLQAKIIQPKGRGATTDTITIFQQRTSKLLPHR